jgi:hypothetical protein
VTYSVALDESTDIAQLAFCIQNVSEDFQLVEEILELVLMKGDTSTDEILFSISKHFK